MSVLLFQIDLIKCLGIALLSQKHLSSQQYEGK
jgi:hypothetical protein